MLPYLIEGMSHPDRFFVGQKCFYALTYLTGHKSGEDYWTRLPEDERRRRQVTSWWYHWWGRNKGKRPILDAAAVEWAQAEVLEKVRWIEMKVKPHYPELYAFPGQVDLTRHWQSVLVCIEYNPRLLAPVPPVRVDRDRLPWMTVVCRSLSEDLPAGSGFAMPWTPHPPAELAGQVETVYSRVLAGTDMIVEVLVASPDQGLIRDLKAALADTDGTGLSASEGLEKPQP